MEKHEAPTPSVREQVIEKISAGQAKMHRRAYFAAQTALFAALIFILLVSLLYLTSLVIFELRDSGLWLAPRFGWRGVRVFLMSLPWLLVIACLGFLIVLEIFVQHYSLVYRRPLVYTVIAMLIIAVIGGWVVARTPLHPALLNRAERGGLPFAGPFYRAYGEKGFPRVHPGTIREITPGGWRMESRRGENLRIDVTPETRLPPHTQFSTGDEVLIFGERRDDTIQAFGILRMDDAPPLQVPPPVSPLPLPSLR
ncbi:MAG: hypothetical protein PHI63_00785 [Patescibacteria group bacterium]|nr:hypothetical protein [Patescibacteria group bacterium]